MPLSNTPQLRRGGVLRAVAFSVETVAIDHALEGFVIHAEHPCRRLLITSHVFEHATHVAPVNFGRWNPPFVFSGGGLMATATAVTLRHRRRALKALLFAAQWEQNATTVRLPDDALMKNSPADLMSFASTEQTKLEGCDRTHEQG